MYSDCDEIPDPKSLEEVISGFDPNQIYNFKNNMYFYYFNILTDYDWHGTTLSSFEQFKQNSVCELRMRRRGLSVRPGGWHLSYMGGNERVLEKMISGNETTLYTPYVKNNIQKSIDTCLITNRDVYGRPCNFDKIPVTEEYLPKYIVDNQEKFKEYILQ